MFPLAIRMYSDKKIRFILTAEDIPQGEDFRVIDTNVRLEDAYQLGKEDEAAVIKHFTHTSTVTNTVGVASKVTPLVDFRVVKVSPECWHYRDLKHPSQYITWSVRKGDMVDLGIYVVRQWVDCIDTSNSRWNTACNAPTFELAFAWLANEFFRRYNLDIRAIQETL